MGAPDGRIDAVFADVDKPRHPGAALLVVDHGERLYSRCYGAADLETGRLITTDTSFYLASISKQFTAMAVMMLAEQGKVSLDDRLPAYLPQFPAWGAEITLRHMLQHTSGLPGCRASSSDPAAWWASPTPPCSTGWGARGTGVPRRHPVCLPGHGLHAAGDNRGDGFGPVLRGLPEGQHLWSPRHEAHRCR